MNVKLCCNYKARPAHVFIAYYPPWAGKVPTWRQARRDTAKRRGWTRRIIRCAHCGRAATILDHHWPYMSGMNRCQQHKNAPCLD